jgi:hypothetical protein
MTIKVRGSLTSRKVLSVLFASGFACAALAGRSEAAGFAAPTIAVPDNTVLAQASPETDKMAKANTKKRKIRCGGPGLPDCPSNR